MSIDGGQRAGQAEQGAPAPSAPAFQRPVLLSGNEAIARGAREAGVRVAAGYPGTPSTEILEALVRFDPGRQVYVHTDRQKRVVR